MLNFNSVMLFSENPKALSDFYKNVFDKEPDWDMEGYVGFKIGDCAITVGPHDEVKGKNDHPQRMMFNFETDDVKGEFARIKETGAEVIKEPYNPGGDEGEYLIATFADPDGNYFQLVSPMKMDLPN